MAGAAASLSSWADSPTKLLLPYAPSLEQMLGAIFPDGWIFIACSRLIHQPDAQLYGDQQRIPGSSRQLMVGHPFWMVDYKGCVPGLHSGLRLGSAGLSTACQPASALCWWRTTGAAAIPSPWARCTLLCLLSGQLGQLLADMRAPVAIVLDVLKSVPASVCPLLVLHDRGSGSPQPFC